ncbi:MAG: 2-amino-4-hydroxy-6-hydroxymethyldihydropteridine diphosphokinase [Chloroflexi bacterium]|nr:2-amino-4-hydroxy-6-hydroxymethyldihydropteridine diphosphokinase [Chloroflexota bacterium]
MSQISLSLGTNLGDRRENLRQAVRRLGERMAVTAVSPVYETEPWGETDQPQFLNICLSAITTHSLRETFNFTQQIENELGRQKTYRWGPRLIDIDILFFDEQTVQDDDLIIPHKSLAERAFVLAPLADIAPDWAHPAMGKSVAEMLTAVHTADVRQLPEPLFNDMEKVFERTIRLGN